MGYFQTLFLGQCLSMSGSIYHQENEDFDYFIPNGNQQSWYSADKSCHQQNGALIEIEDNSEIAIAAQLFIKQNAQNYIEGFWVGILPEDNLCYILDSFGILTNVTCSDTVNVQTGGIYLGLCYRGKENFLEETLYYGCQCPENHGYENCTFTDENVGSVPYGHTYCSIDDPVELNSGSTQFPLLFIDHAAYGRPLTSDYTTCKPAQTALDTEKVIYFDLLPPTNVCFYVT